MKDCSQQNFVIGKSLQRNGVLWISSIKGFVKYPTASSAVGLDRIAAATVVTTQQKLLSDLETGAISLYLFSDGFTLPPAHLRDSCIFLGS